MNTDDNTQDRNNEYTGMFVGLAMVFVTCLLVSNLIAGKLWEVWEDVTLPAAVILFPVTYILADVFTEVYGFVRARLVIWIGFACSFLAVFAYVITIILPYPHYWLDQSAYGVVLGIVPRVLAASFMGYLVGELSNSVILSKLKVYTKGKYLWIRTIGSTVVGEGLDSAIFILIAFAGTVTNGQLFKMMLFQYLFKLCFEVILTPLTYWVVGALKSKEGIDTYDYEQKYKII
ncbi:MAG: queuosine precursor transporter [Lachnospiraceae bacterium]|nr:queuosine precursor transporter [Lachnospiraceae bacterium]